MLFCSRDRLTATPTRTYKSWGKASVVKSAITAAEAMGACGRSDSDKLNDGKNVGGAVAQLPRRGYGPEWHRVGQQREDV